MVSKRNAFSALLAAWVAVSLACNSPIRPARDPNAQVHAQQTQAAERFLTVEAGVNRTLTTTPPGPAEAPPEHERPVSNEPLPVVTLFPTDPPPAPEAPPLGEGMIRYTVQPGDTPAGLAGRFGVSLDSLANPPAILPQAYLPPGQVIDFANRFSDVRYTGPLLPDGEVIYSPATIGFSVADAVQQPGGFLSGYSETVKGEKQTAAEEILRVAGETSINPRLLLALVEFRTHLLTGQPARQSDADYPVGFNVPGVTGLYLELSLAARYLTIGYYGWRAGSVTSIEFANGERVRADPTLNAGSLALQVLFARLYSPNQLQDVLYGPAGFVAQYAAWYGDPWQRAAAYGPLLSNDIHQPALELPFSPGETWSFTGGPHEAWGIGSPWSALDFAPTDEAKGCFVSRFWATAAAPGLITRAGNGLVALDLDMDGFEQTGWVVVYLHIASTPDRVTPGAAVNAGDPIGHPSCEGGVATGKHQHIMRKYNGEWMAADGPVPFVLSGWQASAGPAAYQGSLVKDGAVVSSRLDNFSASLISR